MTERHTDPAFPFVVPLGNGEHHCELGISRREYFAAMAMQGMIAHQTNDSYITDHDLALCAVRYADNMIAVLNEVKR